MTLEELKKLKWELTAPRTGMGAGIRPPPQQAKLELAEAKLEAIRDLHPYEDTYDDIQEILDL